MRAGVQADHNSFHLLCPHAAAGAAVALLAVLGAVRLASGPRQPAVLRPFPGPQLKQLRQFGGQHADRLLWGTYRPGYYFGGWIPCAEFSSACVFHQASSPHSSPTGTVTAG